MKRIFISFATEDARLRDLLVGQSKNDNCPFEFVDMSVKKPWDHAWKTQCRTKIKGCDGVIAIITRNTRNADGEIWEVNCARDEGIPCLGIWGHDDDRFMTLPQKLGTITIRNWSWPNLANWIRNLP